MMGGETEVDSLNALSGGRQSILGDTEAKISKINKKKRKKANHDFVLRQLLRQARARLWKIIELCQERMDELYEEIKKQEDVLDVLDMRYRLLKAELNYFEEYGRFNLDDFGRFKNDQTEQIRSVLERSIGHQIDLYSSDSYDHLLNAIQNVHIQKGQINVNLEANKTLYIQHKQNRDEALKLWNELQNGNLNQQQAALKKYDSFLNDFDKGSENVEMQKTQLNQNYLSRIKEEFSFNFPSLQKDSAKNTTVNTSAITQTESTKFSNERTNEPGEKGVLKPPGKF